MAHVNAWFPSIHLLQLQYADLVGHCLYLHQQCLVIVSLDGLFEVTGAKCSCNILLQAVNAYENSKFSLKLY